MEVHNEFGNISKFGSEYPESFLVGAFVTCPTDKIQEFAGMTAVVNLGIQDFRYLEFGFVLDSDGWWWGLNSVRDRVWKCWFQHGDMENRVYSMETIQQLQSD